MGVRQRWSFPRWALSAPLPRYALAVLVAAAALLFLLLLRRADSLLSAPLLAAVAISAVIGGTGPGLLTAGLGAVALNLWFVPPIGSLATGSPPDVIRQFVLLAAAVLLAMIGGAARRGRVRAEAQARETERLRAEAERSAERFRLATDAVIGALYEYDYRDGTVSRTAGLHQMFGYHPDEVPPTTDWWKDRIHPDDLAAATAGFERAVESGGLSLHYRVRHRDGRWRYVDDRAMVVKDGEGRPLKLVGFARDVTDRVRAEAALRASERQLRLVADSIPVMIAQCDAEGRYKLVNKAYAERFGMTPEEVIGRRIPEVAGEAAYAAVEPYVKQAFAGRAVEVEMEIPYRTGSQVMRLALVPERDPSGKVVGMVGAGINITDRKQAEEARRLSEARLTAILQQLPVGIGVMDREGTWTLSNELLRRYMPGVVPSRHPEEMARWSAFKADGSAVAPEDWPAARALRGEVVMPGLEMVHTLEDGRNVWTRMSAAPLRDETGTIVGATAVLEDIDREKRQHELLRESEARLRLALDSADMGSWEWNVVTGEILWSPRTRELFGLDADTPVTFELFESLVHPDDVAANRRIAEEALVSGDYESEYRVSRSNGDVRWIAARGRLVRDAQGRPARMLGVVWDVTQRKRAEQELADQRSLLEAITENAQTSVFLLDPAGRALFVNPAAEEMTGYSRSELVGRTLHELLHHSRPDGTAYPAAECPIHRALPSRESLRGREEVFIHKDGRRYPVRSNARPVLRDGEPIATVVEAWDITQELEAAAALKESEERYRTLFSSVSEGFALKEAIPDPEGTIVDFRFLDVNPAFELQTGLSGVVGRTMREAMPALEDSWIQNFAQVVQTGRPVRFQERVAALDRWFEVFASRVGGPESRRVAVLLGDITERKRAEAALRSADRMEAVGRLAGGVAHEANNQMTVVLGCASFALLRPDLPPEVRQELLNIQRAGERTAVITSQLLAFSRRQALQPAPLDLNEAVEAFVPILRRTLGDGCELALELQPGMEKVLADRGQIEQVLVNLTFNARDAMPKGGRMTLETGPVSLAEPRPGSDPAEPLPPGRYGVLTVRDTGAGMSPETLARMFEPFFTTKPLGQGTGLGLSTVYGIVRQLGGDIQVESAPGAGTTLRIFLPLAESRVTSGRAPARQTPRPVAGTVLVVEDEPLVRALAVRALRAEGYEVLQAEHGQHALEVLARHPGTVHAVVTDVAMPVMAGRELAERLARSHPGLPVLLTSGYTADELVRRGLLEGVGEPLLPKPYAPEVLVERVRALVESARAGR